MKQLKSVKAVVPAAVLAVCILFTACGKEGSSVTSGKETVFMTATSEIKISTSESASPSPFPDIVLESEYNYTLSLAEFASKGSDIANLVNSYNMRNPSRAIKIADTGSHDPFGEIPDTVKTRLLAELNEGNGPDILVLTHDLLVELNEKEKLADIDELCPNLKAELIPAVAELGTVNGTFVGLAPYIDTIYTCAVPAEYYSGTTWNLADVLDIMDANSGLKRTFVARTTKMYNNIQSRWESLFKVYGLDWTDSGFIDYDNRKADFCNDDFVRLLNRMREDSKNPYDYGAGIGQYLALYDELSDPIKIIRLLMNDKNVFAGIPSREGIGNRFDVMLYIAVNKDCKDPEAVKDFLNSVMYTNTSYRIPVRIYDIRNILRFAPDDYGSDAGKLCYVTTGLFGDSLWSIDHYDDDLIVLASKYEEFLRNLRPYESNYDIQIILTEEIQDFIENNGETDAVAERIQKRVQKYLDGLE